MPANGDDDEEVAEEAKDDDNPAQGNWNFFDNTAHIPASRVFYHVCSGVANKVRDFRARKKNEERLGGCKPIMIAGFSAASFELKIAESARQSKQLIALALAQLLRRFS